MQLSARLVALLAVTAAAGFVAAFAVARSGADDGGATAPPAKTLPSVAAASLGQTVRGVGAAAALPELRRRPRTNPQTHTEPTTPTPTTTTQPPITTTQPPVTTQQSRPPPTTTQSAPPVTTQSG